MHSFHEMCIGDELKLQGKKDSKLLNRQTVVLIAQALFLKTKTADAGYFKWGFISHLNFNAR